MERSDSEEMDFIFIQDDAGNRLCKAAWDENGIRLRLKLPGCRGEGSRTVNIDLSEYINLIMKTLASSQEFAGRKKHDPFSPG